MARISLEQSLGSIYPGDAYWLPLLWDEAQRHHNKADVGSIPVA